MAGIYIHLPFCTQKCTYCNYLVSTETGLEERYVDAVLAEIKAKSQSGEWEEVLFSTIYFGGGTPSKLEWSNVGKILSGIQSHFTFSKQIEISLEANPEDIGDVKLKGWAEVGVNRLSLGVQSMNSSQLDWMKRAHGVDEATRAIMEILSSDLASNFSTDLIFGLPNQSMSDWLLSLESVLALNPPHLSLYGLEALENSTLQTNINRGQLEVIDEDAKSDQYLKGLELAESKGYHSYELASFSKPGNECQHNLHYWSHRDYLGLGVAAHSMRRVGDAIERSVNVQNLHTYMSTPSLRDEKYKLEGMELANEYIMLRLRTAEGLNMKTLKDDYGYELLREKLELMLSFNRLGLIYESGEHAFALSHQGRLQAEQITAALMG